MKTIGRNALVAWMILSLSVGAAGQSVGFSPSDTKELASYRLTMDTVKKVQTATRAMLQEMREDPKFAALMKLNREIDALEKKEEKTDEDFERLEKLREQKDQQEEAMEDKGLNFNNAKNLDDMEAAIKSQPAMVRALTSAGLTPREYSKFLMTLLMSAMVAGFQKSGAIKELPKDLQAIHPDNVKFVLEHEAELKAMQEEWQKMGR